MTLRRFTLASFVVASLAALVALAPPNGDAWPPTEPAIERPTETASNAPPSVELRERGDGTWDVSFSLSLARDARRVVVAGDFNGWNRDALEMRRGADGVWRATTTLKPGAWQYKFVVDGNTWLQDPRNPLGTDDNNGGQNSVLKLGALANLSKSLAKRGDGAIDAVGLGHEPDKAMFTQRESDGRWILRFRTLANDVDGVDVLVRGEQPVPMDPIARTELFQYWEATLPPIAERTPYTFRLRDGATVVRHHTLYKLESKGSPLRTPQWAKDAIWYQIMPDRFRSGSAANDPKDVRAWTGDWYAPSDAEKASGKEFYGYVFDRLYGGDLQGVREKLGYLKDLGVNAIYFTPIFQSPSLHRYDATNYVHVEEYLGVVGDYAKAEASEDLLDPKTWTFTGSDKVFLDFLKVAKSMGFRVIVDGVFNHVGTAHPAFVDVRKNGKKSRFADWFAVKKWEPFEYEGWAGFGGMPVFRKDDKHGIASPTAREHIFNVTRRWMDPNGDGDPSDGVDGWRLDVPNEIPMPFWHEWRTLVKSINPDAYICGEIWRRADDWLDGTSMDAVMNYPFAEGAIAWIGNRAKKITPTELDRRLSELRLAYPSEATYVLQNLVDSHDTDRVASMMMNPDRDYNRDNRPQDGARDYVASKPDALAYRKVRLLALLQMTYVGAPMVWYGDEAGMWGSSDPTNRKPMLWKDLEPYARSEENHAMDEQLAWYRAVIALRNALPALRTGSFRTLVADDAKDVWAFERELGGQRVVVALNASERDATIALPKLGERGAWREVFASDANPPFIRDGRDVAADFPKTTIPALGGRVWESKR
ncbi:MAG: alpha amylase N-terminal ig-like domain-containing protein [Phycisphaerales bacterium]